MIPSLPAGLKAWGYAAVMIVVLLVPIGLATTSMSDHMKLLFLLPLVPVFLVIARRLDKWGDQGTIDVEITADAVRLLNIPEQSAPTIFRRALNIFERQQGPLLIPYGQVEGSPANPAKLVEGPARPPDEPRAIPSDAASIPPPPAPPAEPS